MGKHIRYDYPEVGNWMSVIRVATEQLVTQEENLARVGNVLDSVWSGEAPKAALAVIKDQISPTLTELIDELLTFRAAILESALDMNDRDRLLAEGPVTTTLDAFAAIV